MKEGPILVVCPAILRYSWAEELERWFPSCLPSDIHLGIFLGFTYYFSNCFILFVSFYFSWNTLSNRLFCLHGIGKLSYWLMVGNTCSMSTPVLSCIFFITNYYESWHVYIQKSQIACMTNTNYRKVYIHVIVVTFWSVDLQSTSDELIVYMQEGFS